MTKDLEDFLEKTWTQYLNLCENTDQFDKVLYQIEGSKKIEVGMIMGSHVVDLANDVVENISWVAPVTAIVSVVHAVGSKVTS